MAKKTKKCALGRYKAGKAKGKCRCKHGLRKGSTKCRKHPKKR